MQAYKTRKITFKELIEVNDWKIKVYTIAKHGDFNHPQFYENAILELPKWLSLKNGFDDGNDKVGFLILHYLLLLPYQFLQIRRNHQTSDALF